jgi:Tol biopolymer transport system component
MSPAWAPDGRRIAICNGNGTEILEVSSGKILAQYPKMGAGRNNLLAWSPSGQHLVLARNMGSGFGPLSYQLAILTLADGSIVWQQEDDNHIEALAWSPNSQYLAFRDVRSIVHVRHML